MSFRGGGGGGGRGGRGGGGRGATTRNGVQIPMGTMTWSEFSEVDRQKPSKSYPPMEERPILSKSNSHEAKVIKYQLNFMRELKQDSVWWPNEEDKKQKDLSRYSDRYLRIEDDLIRDGIGGGGGGVASSLSLRDDSIVTLLQKDAFPVGLWNLYMAAETKRQEKEKIKEEQKKNQDWKRVLDRVELAGGDRLSDRASSEDEDEGQVDEYEDDEEDDYADNYFDNGEDDDIQEEGGEGAEETYE